MRGMCVELRRGGGGLRRIRTGLDDVPGGCVSDSSGSAAGWMTRDGMPRHEKSPLAQVNNYSGGV